MRCLALFAATLLVGACSVPPSDPATTISPEQERIVERPCREWRNFERDLTDEQARVCQVMGYGR